MNSKINFWCLSIFILLFSINCNDEKTIVKIEFKTSFMIRSGTIIYCQEINNGLLLYIATSNTGISEIIHNYNNINELDDSNQPFDNIIVSDVIENITINYHYNGLYLDKKTLRKMFVDGTRQVLPIAFLVINAKINNNIITYDRLKGGFESNLGNAIKVLYSKTAGKITKKHTIIGFNKSAEVDSIDFIMHDLKSGTIRYLKNDNCNLESTYNGGAILLNQGKILFGVISECNKHTDYIEGISYIAIFEKVCEEKYKIIKAGVIP